MPDGDEQKIHKLGFLSLKMRRVMVYFDMVEVYKMVNNITGVNYRQRFSLVRDLQRRQTRQTDNQLDIGKESTREVSYHRMDTRKHFFTNRVIPRWNSLPGKITKLGYIP